MVAVLTHNDHPTTITGNQSNRQAIHTMLKALNPAPKDVLFVEVGHRAVYPGDCAMCLWCLCDGTNDARHAMPCQPHAPKRPMGYRTQEGSGQDRTGSSDICHHGMAKALARLLLLCTLSGRARGCPVLFVEKREAGESPLLVGQASARLLSACVQLGSYAPCVATCVHASDERPTWGGGKVIGHVPS